MKGVFNNMVLYHHPSNSSAHHVLLVFFYFTYHQLQCCIVCFIFLKKNFVYVDERLFCCLQLTDVVHNCCIWAASAAVVPLFCFPSGKPVYGRS